MGVVFCARDALTGQIVALKIPWVGSHEENVALLREGELLAKISHPGVVAYVSHGMSDEKQAYLVTEWIEGEDLKQRQSREPLTLRGVLKLGLRLCEALGAVHAAGLVHRDVKPSNVLIRQGEPMRIALSDFGVAIAAGESASIGIMVGTPAFMAPEQALGDPNISARADVFSLGCILFGCLTGRAPFVGEDSVAVLAKLLLDEAPRLRDIRPDAPRWIDEYLALLLARDPLDRPENAAIAGEELRRQMQRARNAISDVSLATSSDSSGRMHVSSPPVANDSAPIADTSPSHRHVLPPFSSVNPPGARATLDTASLLHDEQRVVAVIIARRTRIGGIQAPLARRDELEITATRFGARLEILADGSIVGSISHIDDATELALTAARCTLSLQASFPGYRIGMAIGLATLDGPTPVGQVIDRVAELLDETTEVSDGIFVDAASEGLLRRHVEIDGSSTPARLRGEKTLPRDGQAARREEGRPMIGRESELSRLAEIARETFEGSTPRVVLVAGEPGIGKTRLRDELVHGLLKRGDRVTLWSAAGDVLHRGALSLLAGLVRSAAGVAVWSSHAAARARLDLFARRVLGADEGALVVDQLASLVSPERSSSVTPENAQLRGDRLIDAWTRVVGAVITQQPLLISLDDLQWADTASSTLLERSLRHSVGPALVVGLVRTAGLEDAMSVWGAMNPEVIHLSPLDENACTAMIDLALAAPLKRGRRDEMIRRSEGNPFFLEELLNMHAGGRGGESPGSLVALLQGRMSTLQPSERRLLRAASVFGMTADLTAVAELLSDSEGLDESARRLADAGVIEIQLAAVDTPRAVFGVGFAPKVERLSFRSTLLRDAVHETLTDADRALGHRVAARWLADRGGVDALTMAEHFELGGDATTAVSWLILAVDQALQGGDLAGVITLVDRAVRCGANGEQLGTLRLQQAEAHDWRGEFEACEENARAAMSLVAQGSDTWFGAVAELAMACGKLGHLQELSSIAGVVLDACNERPCPSALVAIARMVSPLTFARSPSVPRLHATLERLAQRLGLDDPSVAGWYHRVLAFHAMTEDDGEAWADHERASADAFARAYDPRNACWQRLNAGYVLLTLGDNEAADQALTETLRTAERLGLTNIASTARQNLGLARLRRGLVDEARRLEEQSIVECEQQRDRAMESSARSYLAEVLVQQGLAREALVQATLAIDLARDFPPWKLSALIAATRAELVENHPIDAMTYANQAIAIVEAPGGADENEISARLVHVRALMANGLQSDALLRLEEARERVRDRATKIRSEERRDRYLRGIPDVREVMSSTIDLATSAR